MKKIILLAIIILILLLGGSYLYTQNNEAVETAPESEPFLIIDDFVPEYNIEVKVDRTGNAKVDSAVETYIATAVANFRKGLEDGDNSSENPYDLIIKSDLYRFSKDINSIQLNAYEYTGGAHSNEYYQTYTYDVITGKIYELKDLFQEEHNPLSTIYPIVKNEFSFLDDQNWVDEGTGDKAEDFKNYKNFVLTENTIIFTIPAYQVAPYVEGPQEVQIPLSDINVVLKPPFYNPSS